jgi:predicted amidohydrolase YtcJ
VAWQDAWVHIDGPESGVHRAYLAADRDGWLTARVVGAMWWDRTWPDDRISAQVARLVEARSAGLAGARQYRPDTVKIMQDGVAETFTAGLLEPYLDRCGHPTGNRGLSFLAPQVLGRVVRELVAADFHVHFHALGDRAVREVLDALAALAPAGDRHQLAHLQVVHPDDIPRFAALGAIANLQPLWACHEPQMDDLTIPFLGAERSRSQYPFAALEAAGARLAMGSDWPVSSPDPLLGVHTAVNRIAPDAPPGTPPLEAAQRLGLESALTAYTGGSRSALGLGPALAVGAQADLVVLDRDVFALPAESIGTARVQRTYAAGRLVHLSE